MDRLSILTLNTWNREGDYKRRKPLIRSWIERLQPDLIGFQEIEQEQTSKLLTGFDYRFEWAGHNDSGLAVASKWMIEAFSMHDLPSHDGLQKGGIVLTCQVKSPAGVVPFVNMTTYYPAMHQGCKREQQMPALMEYVRSVRIRNGFPVVLVGDFNTEPESDEIRYLRGLHSISGTSAFFCDAWERASDGSAGATWTTRNPYSAAWGLPDRRIDYIFIGSPGITGAGAVRRCEVVCNVPVDGVWPSDHFGVFAEIQA
jgi:endonuclease/exonuclease/phosphatase family metal-dependent hydrolase